MNIKEKIDRYILQPDVKLLSQIPISDAEYQELLQYIRYYINHMYMQTIVPANLLIATGLVQIAIRTYTEGNYWDYFISEICMDLSASKRNYLGQIFASTIKQYHLFEIKHEKVAKHTYVENMKAHAFVPNNYLRNYFDFLFAFYDKNILRQLPDNIEADFSEMAEFFSNTLSDSSDIFSLTNFDNKPAKSYKLLKATRALFAQGDPVILSNKLYHHLQIIDNFYYDDKYPDKGDRFEEAFCQWQEKASEGNDSIRSNIRRKTGAFYHKPYFYVNRMNADAKLIIPEQKIRDDEFSGEVFVNVANEGISKEYRLNLYRAFGVIVSDQLQIPCEDIFAHYEITIKSASERKFDIPERNYRIFDADSVEMLKLCTGQNYLLTRKGTKVRGYQPVYIDENCPSWNVYSFSGIDDSSVIYIDNCSISITGTFAEGPDFAYVSQEYNLFSNDREIQTAYRHPTLSFRIDRKNKKGSFLWCNGVKYHVDEVASALVELSEDLNNYGVTVILEDILSKEAGLYRIFLDEPARQQREICKYVYLPELRCYPEKPRFIFDSEACINITGGYIINPINAIQVQDGGNEYLVDLKQGFEQGEFNLSIDDCTFKICVPLQIFKHGFEKQWQYERPDYIWAPDLKNDLYISMPGATEAIIYVAEKDFERYAFGLHQGNGVFRFEISELVEYIRNSSKAYNYISLKYKDNKERNLSLYRVLNRIYVDKADVIFDHEHVYVDVQYKGKNDLVLRFCEEGTDIITAEKTVSNGRNEFPELSPSGLYTMHTFETSIDPFGFSNEKKSILNPRYRIGAIDLDDISNCKINLISVLWSGEKLPLDYSYAVFSLEKHDDLVYSGVLCEQRKDPLSGQKSKALQLVNPLLIECIVDDGALYIISARSLYDEGTYDPLYYDKSLRKLTRSDLISSIDYSRFVALYDDLAEYHVSIRRIK